MKVVDILKDYVVEGKLTPLFTQLFVEENNTLNYRYFLKFHDLHVTFAEVNEALKELTGTKAVKFNEEGTEIGYAWETFINSMYDFGVYPFVRGWINKVHEDYGVVLPRKAVLSWVASQHPKKQESSFSPTNDRNLYGKDFGTA